MFKKFLKNVAVATISVINGLFIVTVGFIFTSQLSIGLTSINSELLNANLTEFTRIGMLNNINNWGLAFTILFIFNIRRLYRKLWNLELTIFEKMKGLVANEQNNRKNKK